MSDNFSALKIYMVVRPSLNEAAVQDFLRDEQMQWNRTHQATPADELVELSGRMCYMSFGDRQSPRTNQEYIQNLILSGHGSVLEHAVWSFILTGVSRSFSHQLVRHRAGFSYSQLSQQYHDEGDANFVLPYYADESDEARQEWLTITENLREAYRAMQIKLMDGRKPRDIPKEELRRIRSLSRSILPNAIETKLSITANARALRHFIGVRGTIEGDLEMRNVCCELLVLLKQDAPALFYDFSVIQHSEDGLPIISLQSNV